jgi:hypothetical protein
MLELANRNFAIPLPDILLLAEAKKAEAKSESSQRQKEIRHLQGGRIWD